MNMSLSIFDLPSLARRAGTILMAVAVVFGSGLLGTEASAEEEERLNILYIIADDMAADSVAAHRDTLGNGPNVRVTTPHLDALAAEGMSFHRAYVQGAWVSGVCNTSRACIMTGRSMWRAPGSPQPDSRVPNEFTLPGVFNSAGYATARYGKTGNDYDRGTATFTEHNGNTNRGATSSKWFADHAIDFIERRAEAGDTDPFLLYVGFSHPHDPRSAPQEYLDAHHANVPSPDPNTSIDLLDPLPSSYLPQIPFNFGNLTGRDENRVAGAGGRRDERTIRNENGKNHAAIEYMDAQIGRILARLEDPDQNPETDDSIRDKTIIVFTSDHGIAIGRHGLMGKQNMYEHSTRVPYIVAGPGIAQGESDAMIYLHESMPTLLDLAGIESPETVDGISFAPALRGEAFEGHDAVYHAHRNKNGNVQRAVHVGDWKLIFYPQILRTQLFNLADDPDETEDLAHDAQYASQVEMLSARLHALQVELNDPTAGELHHIGVNVAYGKPATQSSTRNEDSSAAIATDGAGSTLSDYSATAEGDTELWWQVDLEGTVSMEKIIIHGPRGNNAGRIGGLTLEIFDENNESVYTVHHLDSPEGETPSRIVVDLVELAGSVQAGRYVRISRNRTPVVTDYDGQPLELDEVQVFRRALKSATPRRALTQ